MKKGRIIDLFKFIGNLKLTKFPKEVRKAILSNHIAFYKIAKEFDADSEEIRKRLFEGKDEEISKLNELREKFNASENEKERKELLSTIIANHSELLGLEREFIIAREDILNEDIEVTVLKVEKDTFIDACVDSEIDITPNILIICEDLFEDE